MDETASFRLHVPRPPLSDFVGIFWSWDSKAPLPPEKERVLPTGTVELVIRLSEDSVRVYDANDPSRYERYSGSVVTGTQSRYFVLEKSEQDSLLGVHFKPGGAFPFFGVAGSELQDRHVSLEDLWGPAQVKELRARLLEAPTVEERFLVLERQLILCANRPLIRHPAVRHALQQLRAPASAPPVSELADRANLSQRRFIQLFSEQVGLTPKLFHRVCRFQEAIQKIQLQQEVYWLDVALSCGYFDQAHFIRDFRDFSGLNPKAYLERRTPQLNHAGW